MPILLLILGILLVVVGINNKVGELADLVKEDFVPSNNSAGFTKWVIALIVIGSLGYIKEFKPVANAFLVLIIISMLLSNEGFFEKFNAAFDELKSMPSQATPAKKKSGGLFGKWKNLFNEGLGILKEGEKAYLKSQMGG